MKSLERGVRKAIRIFTSPGRWPAYGRKAWVGAFAPLTRLSLVGPAFTRLCALGVGPYKAKRRMVKLTGRTYLSPHAQVHGLNVDIGEKCFLDEQVTIYVADRTASVILSEGVYLYRGTMLEAAQGGKIQIGSGTHIQPYCTLNSVVGELAIGHNVQIAAHCGFFPYRHRMDRVDIPIQDQGFASKGGIIIEDDVWVGTGVKVMDGVRLGCGSVVGAGAVVTRDVPPYGIAVGSPARVIRKRKKLERSEDRGELDARA